MENLKNLLRNARFYGAKSEPIDRVEVVAQSPALGHTMMVVRVYHGGRTDLYQLLIDDRGEEVLGEAATELGAALAAGTPAGFGTLHGDTSALTGLSGVVIDGEQTNTSLNFENQMMVKYFRKLEAGFNPDVELLTGIPDCPHVAPVSGWVTAEIDGAEYTLAMVQEFIPETVDGWKYALGFARMSASFGPEADLLGTATFSVHQALAEEFPVDTVPASALAESLSDHLTELTARASVLKPYVAQASSFYRGISEDPTPVQRIHGDLHLGQVLRGSEKYVLIDFEGEPARSMTLRRQPDSPFRDIAGMLRSFDYAATVAQAPESWVTASQQAFLSAYGLDTSPLLQAYLLDKALYEVAYEANHRPGWVDVPLDAVKRLLQ